jgi:HAE1 family hydrophobic/amphiphilic exporter-1
VLANNKDIAVTHLDVQRARFNVQAARGAYDPVIGGQATYQDEVSPVSSFLGGSTSGSVTQKTFNFVPRVSGAIPGFGSSYAVDFSSQRVTSNSQFLSLNPQFPTALSFGFTQPLLRNFSIDVAREQIEVATKNQNLSAEQLRQQLIVTLSQAEQAYWQLRFAKDNLDVRVQGLQLAREQAGSNERRANAGTLAPVDVVEAQTQVATAEQSVYQAQQTLTAAENTLKSLMLPDRLSPLWSNGLVPTSDFDVSAATIPLDQAIAEALSNRPELAENQISASINDTTVRFAQNQMQPQLDIVANYTTSGLAGAAVAQTPIAIPGVGSLSSTLTPQLVGGYGQSLSNLINQRFPTFELGLQFGIPIRNRTAQANLGSALVQRRQIKLQREQIEEIIEADVRNALQSVESANARLNSAASGRRFAEELYASEQRKFKAGTTTVFLLFQRENAMIAARTQFVRAQADLSIAISQYQAALGATLKTRNITVKP